MMNPRHLESVQVEIQLSHFILVGANQVHGVELTLPFARSVETFPV